MIVYPTPTSGGLQAAVEQRRWTLAWIIHGGWVKHGSPYTMVRDPEYRVPRTAPKKAVALWKVLFRA